jgi:hypothetical protein
MDGASSTDQDIRNASNIFVVKLERKRSEENVVRGCGQHFCQHGNEHSGSPDGEIYRLAQRQSVCQEGLCSME